ncbi:uncharacterized protein LOC123988650 [Osmia bicornis bicornis]|uniref:uncharacterized protein LOC123988650 n=1 Tax=Osmia bicornis bicornis TaxID=1437191 RepID=UPI001EAEC59A|nr:uncharacterized protein LOC123988650 [Osmia bicornis bicornis]
MAEKNTKGSRARDVMTLLVFYKTCKEIFQLDALHPNEKVTITTDGRIIFLTTDSGAVYKLDGLTLSDVEYRVINEAIEKAESGGFSLVMHESKNQLEKCLKEITKENTISKTNMVSDRSQNDRQTAAETTSDSSGPGEKRSEGSDLTNFSENIAEMVTAVTELCKTTNSTVTTAMHSINSMRMNFEKETKLMRSQIREMGQTLASSQVIEEGNDEDLELPETSENANQTEHLPNTSQLGNIPRNDLTSILTDVIRNLGSSNLNSSNQTNPVAKELKETIKLELISKDSGTKRDYKLTTQMKFEHFFDYFSSELREKDLLYVIDSSEMPNSKLDDVTKEKHKFKVRDILINRLDNNYHSKILNIKNPVELLNKIKEIKRSEINVTSGSIRKQLYNIQYNPQKEKATEFWDKFEELIRSYENSTETARLTDGEIRDAFYNAIMTAVPQVQAIDFMTRNTTGKGLTYEQLKMYIMQTEANKMTTMTNTGTALNARKLDTKERCFNCDDFGHISRNCPRKGTGLKKCFECNEFVTHKAFECPLRIEKLRRDGPLLTKDSNYRRGNSRLLQRGCFNNKRGLKRKGHEYDRENESKRPRFPYKRGKFGQNRGGRNEKRPKYLQQKGNCEVSAKDKANKSA